jgi:desumoylating isopeptidase 1
MTCNLFSSPLYADEVLSAAPSAAVLRDPLTQLIASSFLDDAHNNVRVAASSLLFNVAAANSLRRRRLRSEGRAAVADAFPDSDQLELAASVLEAISQESASAEALQGMLLALGYLVYLAPLEGSELVDLLRTMDAQDMVLAKAKEFPQEELVKEVGEELLGKGLRRK